MQVDSLQIMTAKKLILLQNHDDRKLNLLDEYEKVAILRMVKLLLIKLKVSSLKSMLMNIMPLN
jgi:hypothetical protein